MLVSYFNGFPNLKYCCYRAINSNKFRQADLALAELIGIATLEKSGLHPAAKFSQGDNSGVSNIDDIDILSTDIYNGNILENNATFIVKTYPASPAYMYQEAFSMYPIKRYWRAKVDGTWRGWIEL